MAITPESEMLERILYSQKRPPTPKEAACIAGVCVLMIYALMLALLWCTKHQDYVAAFFRFITFGLSE